MFSYQLTKSINAMGVQAQNDVNRKRNFAIQYGLDANNCNNIMDSCIFLLEGNEMTINSFTRRSLMNILFLNEIR